MENVKVKKEELLDRLTANRSKHRAIFEDALEGYRKAVIKALDASLEDARAGRKINQYLGLVEPQDHTAEYDAVLDMVEMSVDSEIVLTYQDFRAYVRDEWGWKQQFIGSTAMYNSKAF